MAGDANDLAPPVHPRISRQSMHLAVDGVDQEQAPHGSRPTCAQIRFLSAIDAMVVLAVHQPSFARSAK